MSSWQEKTARIAAMRTARDAAVLQKYQKKKEANRTLHALEVERACKILEQIGARQALQDVKDHKWEEIDATIDPVETEDSCGLKLATTVPKITIESPGCFRDGRGGVRIGTAETALSVTVDSRGNNRSPYININDQGLFPPAVAKSEKPILYHLVRKYGVVVGLERAISMFNFQGLYLGNSNFWIFSADLEKTALPDEFDVHFAGVTTYRKNIHSLPSEIRERVQDIIDQLSPFINSEGYASGADLFYWEQKIAKETAIPHASHLARLLRLGLRR